MARCMAFLWHVAYGHGLVTLHGRAGVLSWSIVVRMTAAQFLVYCLLG